MNDNCSVCSFGSKTTYTVAVLLFLGVLFTTTAVAMLTDKVVRTCFD